MVKEDEEEIEDYSGDDSNEYLCEHCWTEHATPEQARQCCDDEESMNDDQEEE